MLRNRNNFLRWGGSLTASPFENIAANHSVVMITGFDYIDVALLTGATSTFGINKNSIIARVRGNDFYSTRPPKWNGETGILRIYRPSITLPNIVVEYSFADHVGNRSNTAGVAVDLTIQATGWRVHPASVYCLKDTYNTNTGYKGYTLLEKYYTATSALYSPLTTTPNITTFPSYVAPTTDTTACPLPSQAPLYLVNDTPLPTAPGSPHISFVSLLWKKTGVADVLLSVPITGGSSSTLTFPTGLYDEVRVAFLQDAGSFGAGYELSFSPGNSSTLVFSLNGGPNPIIISNPAHAQPGSTFRLYHP